MIIKLRAIILYFFCIIVFCVSGSIYLLAIILLGPHKSVWVRQIFCWLMIHSTLNKLVVISKPPDCSQTYLYLPNHQSMFDAFMMGLSINQHITVVAKQEAFSIPLFGLIIKMLGAVSINRKDHANSMAGISLGAEKVKSGISMVVFPEGTRTKDGQIGLFKKGAFKLAFDAQATIVPVGIIGSCDSQPWGNWIIKPGILKINYGRPIFYSEYKNFSITELSDFVRNIVSELSSSPK